MQPHAPTDDEKNTLLGILDALRDSVASKLAGAPEPDAREPQVPSGTSLLGLIKHLTAVERFYFLGEEPPSWPATFRPTPQDTTTTVLAAYREATTRANAIISTYPDTTHPAPDRPRPGPTPTLRWTLAHLIEETARHAGHADILREQLDGTTGR